MQQVSKFRRTRVVFGIALMALAMLRCGGDDGSGAPCQVNDDCRKKTSPAPTCADKAAGVCLPANDGEGPDKVCVYTAKLSTTCWCIEGDARLCTLDDGTRAVRQCVATKNSVGKATGGMHWDDCKALDAPP